MIPAINSTAARTAGTPKAVSGLTSGPAIEAGPAKPNSQSHGSLSVARVSTTGAEVALAVLVQLRRVLNTGGYVSE